MFDIGFSELLIIALVALIVLGPERLPKAARFTGLWVRRARAQWYAVKSELENEIADDELKRTLHDTRRQFEDAGSTLRAGIDDTREAFQSHARSLSAAAAIEQDGPLEAPLESSKQAMLDEDDRFPGFEPEGGVPHEPAPAALEGRPHAPAPPVHDAGVDDARR